MQEHPLSIHRPTVRVSHWPITWPMYLPCTVAQGQSHCASNIISNSHPFHSNWVDPPIPETQQFQYFTLKIQGQGYWWGQSWKSKHGPNTLWTPIPFVLCQSAIPFPSEWVIKFKRLSWTADIEVHIVHISRVIIGYTLESLSSIT